MGQKLKEKDEMELYSHENNPNAAILIYAFQNSGYKNDVALCDIIDNSIDAGATKIWLYIEKDRIIIADNGKGMKINVLDEALKLGSNVIRNENAPLGKFGMGLSTASISIANRTTVLTKHKMSEQIFKSSVDINIIKLKNKFVKYFGEADKDDEEMFNKLLKNEKSGTIVILEQCVGIKNRNVNQFSGRMKTSLGRIYRKFMSKIEFYVNDMKVEEDDPLLLDDEGTEEYSETDYEVKWKDKNGNEKKSNVHVKLVILPLIPKDEAKQKKINMQNQGFSILRNSREIAFGYMPWVPKHNRFNRMRGEISFESDMDDGMGVDFTKNGIDMMDSVNDILQQYIKPQMLSIANKAQKEKAKESNKNIDHGLAERKISGKANILIMPSDNETNYTHEENKNEENIEKTTTESNESKKKTKSTPNVKFLSASAGRTGNIYDARLEGKTTVIEWNIDHPFYDKFILSNTENTELVTAVDHLIYSMATAQLKVLGDDENKAEIISQLISVMSNNMRILLS